MKKKMLSIIMLVCIFLSGCALKNVNTKEDSIKLDKLWETATYKEDKTFGNGSKTLYVKVEAGETSVTFTIKTDKTTVGDALKEHKLVTGENGQYGLYIKSVNGIFADYNVDKSYWSFNKNGEYMQTGVDKTEFADGDSFELVYTK